MNRYNKYNEDEFTAAFALVKLSINDRHSVIHPSDIMTNIRVTSREMPSTSTATQKAPSKALEQKSSICVEDPLKSKRDHTYASKFSHAKRERGVLKAKKESFQGSDSVEGSSD